MENVKFEVSKDEGMFLYQLVNKVQVSGKAQAQALINLINKLEAALPKEEPKKEEK